MAHWCDVFVVHFPEAGRFDLITCCYAISIVDSWKVGNKPIAKARQWSKDYLGAQGKMTVIETYENKNKKWKVKVGSKAQINKRKMAATQESSDITKLKIMTEEEAQQAIQDIRLLHRPQPKRETAPLSSMPIQLHNGEAVDPLPMDLDQEDDSIS